MYFYYGGKRALAGRYDPPEYPVIVEPFAGSAGYAMRHLAVVDRVLLVEKDARVVELWRRLLAMEPAEVLALPVPKAGEETADFLHMTAAASNAIARCSRMLVTERMPRVIGLMLHRIAAVLPEAKRKVEVVHGDYRDAPDVEACWFVDPPYQATGAASGKTWFPQGMGYAPGCTAGELDYAELAEWCRARRGQVIVCEQEGAAWLPFRPLQRPGRVRGDSVSPEVVWTSRERRGAYRLPGGAVQQPFEHLPAR